MKHAALGRRMLAAAALSLVLGGCPIYGWGSRDRSFIENGTDSTIIVYVVQPDGEVEFLELRPGAGGTFGTGCNGFALVARTTEGDEVERMARGDLCNNETWVVTGD